MKESIIENYLRQQVLQLGGTAYKFSSPQNNAVPDRLITMPHGLVYFVELKATGVKPSKLQLLEHERLRRQGHLVYVIDSKHGVDEFITKIKSVQDKIKIVR